MNDTDKNTRLPISNVTVRETLREMALDMEVALYRRYSMAEATKVLNISEKELGELRTQGQIGYLDLGTKQIGFFGCQLLTYLLECVVPPGSEVKPRPTTARQSSKPEVNPEAELISVDQAISQLGIGKTKFYDLLKTNQIKSVKIGRRTLIKREELRQFIDSQVS